MVVDDASSTGDSNVYLYDIVTQSWTKGSGATYLDVDKTNLIIDSNGDLTYATSNAVEKWSDISVEQEEFENCSERS